MVALKELISTFERLWPLAGAEKWDAPGLISGDLDAEISKVLLTVDVTAEVVGEAVGQYDLVLAHHPYLLRGITTAAENTAKGALLAKAIRGSLAIYAAHTNADIVADGVSDVLARSLGIIDAKPLVSEGSPTIGHGRIGVLEHGVTLGEFARQVSKVLPSTATGVRVAGTYNQVIKKVAVCGGAGDSFIAAAVAAQADAYVTADLRHHVVQEAREEAIINGDRPALIDVSHWASEWLWLDVAAAALRREHPLVDFVVSDLRTDPFDFVITQ